MYYSVSMLVYPLTFVIVYASICAMLSGVLRLNLLPSVLTNVGSGSLASSATAPPPSTATDLMNLESSITSVSVLKVEVPRNWTPP